MEGSGPVSNLTGLSSKEGLRDSLQSPAGWGFAKPAQDHIASFCGTQVRSNVHPFGILAMVGRCGSRTIVHFQAHPIVEVPVRTRSATPSFKGSGEASLKGDGEDSLAGDLQGRVEPALIETEASIPLHTKGPFWDSAGLACPSRSGWTPFRRPQI